MIAREEVIESNVPRANDDNVAFWGIRRWPSNMMDFMVDIEIIFIFERSIYIRCGLLKDEFLDLWR